MKKKLLSLLLAAAMTCSMIPTAFAASNEAIDAANALHDRGLFNGVGTNADGTPNFDLDRTPTRHEAVTMLVAMLGKSSEAQAGNWTTPFTDVADWAKPFVGYAYTNGLTSGTSATTYGGNQPVDATQYLTFVLTALGYKNGVDFQWNKAWELSDKLGITNGQYNATSTFTRGDVAVISYKALSAPTKDTHPESETAPIDLQGCWYSETTGDNGKVVECFYFSGNNFVHAGRSFDSLGSVDFTAYEEGTFSFSDGILTWTRTASYTYYEDFGLYMDTDKVTAESSIAKSGNGFMFNGKVFFTRSELSNNLCNEFKNYVMAAKEKPIDIDGYWLGINNTSDGAQFVEYFNFSGSNYSCAYKAFDANDTLLFTNYEEGTFVFSDGVLTLTRTAEYSYKENTAKTQTSTETKVLEYKVAKNNGGILLNNWTYMRMDQAEATHNQFKDYVMEHNVSINSADYAYLAGSDFRSIRRDYPHAVAQCAYVYAFTDMNGDLCVLTDVRYKITKNWSQFTLHNLTKGTQIIDPDEYYTNLAQRAYGGTKIYYMNMSNEVRGHHIQMLSAMSNVLKGGANTFDGVFVNATTLNL